jgi:hypothetical protein
VTSVSAASTDTQYPTAKAVWNQAKALADTIGALSALSTVDKTSVVAAVNEVLAALSSVSGIAIQVVTTLPATGANGVIYFVPRASGVGYVEWIWLSGSGQYEEIGDTDIDLSGYVTTAAFTAHTGNGTIHVTSADKSLWNTVAQKAPINNPTFTGTVGGITKAMVGLGNAENTLDVNKPISAAAQAALANKADLVNGKVPQSQLPDMGGGSVSGSGASLYLDDIPLYGTVFCDFDGEDIIYNLDGDGSFVVSSTLSGDILYRPVAKVDL